MPERYLYFRIMYHALKKVALAIVPKKFLFKNELFFRSVFSFKYRGKKYECSVCGKKNNQFIKIPGDDLLCPFCGSRARTRRLYSYLTEKNLLYGNVLHFSPSRSIYRILAKNENIAYFSTDFEDQFIAQYNYDITAIPKERDVFDLIICYHILEHIVADQKAMAELSRVLKPSGKCLIQTPFKVGSIYEDYAKTTKQERLEAFGQDDHVRIYSVEGLKDRLLLSGFKNVEVKNFPENKRFGFTAEIVLIASK